jgi:hypothetical protein
VSAVSQARAQKGVRGMNDWIAFCKELTFDKSFNARAVYRDGDEVFIQEGGYIYQYYSPYRPLDYIGASVDCVVTRSTKPYTDMMFTKEPIPNDRLYKWELVPVNEAAQKAMP